MHRQKGETKMKDRLKKLRKVLNLKQREVAERLGITVGTVGQWESGVAVPGDARIYQLCKEYNVRREWLERGEGEMFEPKPTEEEIYVEMFGHIYDNLSPKSKGFRRIARDKFNAEIPEEED